MKTGHGNGHVTCAGQPLSTLLPFRTDSELEGMLLFFYNFLKQKMCSDGPHLGGPSGMP